MKNMVTIFCGLTIVCLVFANEFTKPKEKPKPLPKLSKLKEKCCADFVSTLERLPDLMRAVANVQDIALENVRNYAENTGEGILGACNKEQVNTAQKTLENLNYQIDQLISALTSAHSTLKTLSNPELIEKISNKK